VLNLLKLVLSMGYPGNLVIGVLVSERIQRPRPLRESRVYKTATLELCLPQYGTFYGVGFGKWCTLAQPCDVRREHTEHQEQLFAFCDLSLSLSL
jgi:hypothetical protein